jgi:hypothetical protein
MYDLSAHLLTHYNTMPFDCKVCLTTVTIGTTAGCDTNHTISAVAVAFPEIYSYY